MASKHVGRVFGNLTVLDAWCVSTSGGNPKQMFRVRCGCGKVYDRTALSILYAKGTTSVLQCRDCVRLHNAEMSARGYKHYAYRIWASMVDRCTRPSSPGYTYYGGRGIYVCDAWLGSRPNGERSTMDGFRQFYSDMGDRPSDSYSLDRIDNDGPYCKDNCRWATASEQQNNKRNVTLVTLCGRTLSITEWGRLLKHPGGPQWAYHARKWGVPLERALAILVQHYPQPVGDWKSLFAAHAEPDPPAHGTPACV